MDGSEFSQVRIVRKAEFTETPDGSVRVVGGEPLTMIRLAGAALPTGARHRERLPRPGEVVRLPVSTATVLCDRGIAVPYPEPPRPWPDTELLARTGAVVPCKDDAAGARTVLDGLAPLIAAGLAVWVVDDGSATPLAEGLGEVPEGVVILRNDAPTGPAAARNRGIDEAERAGRQLVVVLDADTVPARTEWLGWLAAHLDREAVAAVAPRIVAAEPGRRGPRGYETAKSALDMGHEPAVVRPRTSVPYVPSTVLLLHLSRVRAALGEGPVFREDMHVAEDVDLCWRLYSAGVEVVYEPRSRVAHRHRLRLLGLLRRRMEYGEGAALLARRHPESIVPAVFSARSLAAAAGLWWARPWTLVLAAGLAVWSFSSVYPQVGRDARLARQLVARGQATAFWQLAGAAFRPYAPATAALAVAASAAGRGRRLRRVLAVAAISEGVRHWWRQRPEEQLPVDGPTDHVVLHRLDDIAYGIGVWRSALRARSLRALRPEIRW